MANKSNDWKIERIRRLKNEAIENAGRFKGQAEAFEIVTSMDDAKDYCQTCGQNFYHDAEYETKHYNQYPTHFPGYIEPITEK
ncbi:MAG: hypothetical protein WC343_14495 [Bacilli bacterium]|jgi:hypothetical protein